MARSHPMLRVLLATIAILLLAPAAHARKADAPPEPLLVAPGTDPAQAQRVALGSTLPPVLLEDLVRDAVGSGARLYGASQIVPCDSTALRPGSLPEVVAAADRFLLELEYELAGDLLQDAAERLPCAEHLVARAPLSELFFLLGVSASYAGDVERAQRWFGQALAVSPNRSFDTDLAPRVYEQYLVAMERHYVGNPVPVTLALGAEEDVEIYVDGALINAREDVPALGDGFHFLQFRRDGDPVVTFEFRVDPGDTVALATPDGALAAALAGPDAPPSLRGVVDAVYSGVASSGPVGSVQIVDGRTVRRFVASGEWETLREPPDRITRIHRTGRVLVGTGLATFGLGVALSAASAATAPAHPTHPDYRRSLTVNRIGISLVVIGMGVGGTGLPLVIAARPNKEQRQARRKAKAGLGLLVGPDGATVSLGGRF